MGSAPVVRAHGPLWTSISALAMLLVFSGCSCNPPDVKNCPEEICNGVDDDCDGEIDELEIWANKDEICRVGIGVCGEGGVFICNPADRAGPTICSGTPGQPTEEVCNGLDDDCDESTDEGDAWATLNQACEVSEGGCRATGVWVCDALVPAGPPVCSGKLPDPVDETCDGFDNDCDGLTDEGDTWADLGTPCTEGIGFCERAGVRVCDPNDALAPTVCFATPGDGAEEVCDARDNDCDGSTDEGLLWTDLGQACTIGFGVCEAAGIKLCDRNDPAGPSICSGQLGTGSTEVCNDLDDDCDGGTDEDATWADRGVACTVGMGICSRTGVKICDSTNPTGATTCSVVPGTAQTEVCDGLDNDCDGSTDEDTQWANLGGVCSVGQGTCAQTGVFICDVNDRTGPSVCSVSGGSPATEVCNGLDDNCDGSTDENWTNKGDLCTEGLGQCTRTGTRVCDTANPAGPTVCSVQAAAAGTEICDEFDNDCDGSTDEDWADKGVICKEGTGLCEATGVRICDTTDTTGPTVCSVSAGAGGTEVCDGLDNDCDGGTDEGVDWANKGTICTDGTGACETAGTWICNATDPTAPTMCSASASASGTEACNGLDDDCDGNTDEEAIWATRGSICTVGTGTCTAVGVEICDAANPTGALVCSVSPGSAGVEVCNALDDDCDGLTDEDAAWADVGDVCTVGTGVCQATGTKVCDTVNPAGPTVCSTSPAPAGTETCNALDDDCDGSTDEITWADKGDVCTSGTGVCARTGIRVCDTASPAGPTVCSSTAGSSGIEVCNSLDDDCDGSTDEILWSDKGDVCTVGLGQCAQTGTRVCDPTDPSGNTVCSAVASPSQTEVCDDLDNDCDGSTDETNWPNKGVGCTAGTGACEAPGVFACNAADPAGPTVCSAVAGSTSTEVCDGLDNDCDGNTDEGALWTNLNTQCSVGTGTCQTFGIFVCDTTDPAGASVCSATPGAAGTEVCNGLDDNCDGNTDEDPLWANKGNLCSVGVGACLQRGTLICDTATPGGALVCSATAGAAGAEVCNALDDDCDGSTDETHADKGDVCTVGTGICAESGTRICDTTDPTAPTVCSATPSAPGTEVCNGLDDNCDGSTDETHADKGDVCTAGTGICAQNGTRVCDTTSPSGPTVCSATPSASATEICNGLDDNCDGNTDEGAAWTDKGTVCSVGTGACTRSGTLICDSANPSGATVCSVSPGAAGTEVCDNIDNDCDGITDETHVDKGTVCSVGTGICARRGTLVCDTTDPTGPTVCSATAGAAGVEVCNGLDDNCDGSTDETHPTKGTVCNTGVGACQRNGTLVCDTANPGGPTICNAVAGAPGTEVCNGLDDNCDGNTDEGALWSNKGTVCSDGTGVCQQSGTFICDALDPAGATICSASPSGSSTEICNGLDDNCDGNTDEGALWSDKGVVCTAGVGQCARRGVKTCDAGDPTGATVCSATAAAPGVEVCNGLDDNCDGNTDEGATWATLGDVCTVGQGICARSGVLVCNSADPSGAPVCSVTQGASGVEVCDELDNDCDGATDELHANKGVVCSVGIGECANDGTRVCNTADPAGPTVCSATASAPGVETCNGLDDNCDGNTDEGATWADLGIVCSVGTGACEESGTKICDSTDPTGPTVCSATASAPGVEVCDGLDNNCDGNTDEGATWADLGDVCSDGTGICLRNGTRICNSADPAGATVCSATQGPAGTEVCDGLDNNCDGSTDEGAVWATLGDVCSSGVGTCLQRGTLICDTANPAGAPVCSATPAAKGTEVCDELDNDCDGGTDETTWADKGTVCTVGNGECANSGTKICNTGNPAGATVCSATAGSPSPEVCDGLDNNCDNVTDEGAAWANKGTGCSSGVGGCERPGIYVCNAADPGGALICSSAPGSPTAEVCDDIDNDCNSFVDDGGTWDNKGNSCTAGTGACERAGIQICNAANSSGPTVCSATAGSPGVETCDGIDNDCNTLVDDALSAPNCIEQDGVCAGSTRTCGGGLGWLPCGPGEFGPNYEPDEVTCDGLDNDCDTLPDDNLPLQPCGNQFGACAGSFASCGGASGWAVCGAAEYGADYEPSELTCDEVDNDCDGTTDNGFINGATGKYDTHTACGNCFTDCTTIFAKPNAYGECNAAGTPQCEMICCTVGDTNPACDGLYDYSDLNGVIGDGCEFQNATDAIYVSTPANGGVNFGGCGTVGSPCATIAFGIAQADADASKTRVLVSGGAYYESVNMIDGISLVGGFNSTTWAQDIEANSTVIYGDAGPGHVYAVNVPATTQPTLLQGFAIYPANASGTESNSYAVRVASGSNNLTIDQNYIYAGTGGPGTNANGGAAGINGVDGSGPVFTTLCSTSATNNTPLSIPDNTKFYTFSDLAVAGSCTINYMTLTIDLTHPNTSDLLVVLRHPDATQLTAVHNGGPGVNLVGTYETTLSLAGPDDFTVFNGKNSAGTWRLGLNDGSKGNIGTLNSWTLNLEERGSSTPYDAFETAATPCQATNNRQYTNGGVRTCAGQDVSGGNGGGNTCDPINGAPAAGEDASGSRGTAGSDGVGALDGAAGAGGLQGIDANNGSSCTVSGPQEGQNGVNGGNGIDGAAGSACVSSAGSVSGGHWTATAGTSGLSGGHGGGGGGGGAGAGSVWATGGQGTGDRLGAHGGGAGSGACGGGGGLGATSGGASIGIFIAGGTAPVITNNTISRGFGGAGGNGGAGGIGGLGGKGAIGGLGIWCAGQAGKGGEGGDGGHGGGGGGGCGGSAFGIFASGIGSPNYCTTAGNTFSGGAGGSAGLGGGSVGNSGPNGAAGLVTDCTFQ